MVALCYVVHMMRQQQDDAVSPVIATILLVAITVVLAATVFIMVSDFGQAPVKAGTLSVVSNGGEAPGNIKSWTVASASGIDYTSLQVVVGDTTVPMGSGDGSWSVTRNGTAITGGPAFAGDRITLDHTSPIMGQNIRVIDTAANAVVLTLRG